MKYIVKKGFSRISKVGFEGAFPLGILFQVIFSWNTFIQEEKSWYEIFCEGLRVVFEAQKKNLCCVILVISILANPK